MSIDTVRPDALPVPAADVRLGAVYSAADRTASFSLWAPTAASVFLLLYKRAKSLAPSARIPLTLNTLDGVWRGTFADADCDGWFYEYEVTTERGTARVLDPYARSMSATTGEPGSGRGAVIDLTAASAQPPGGWEGFTGYTLEKREDAVIYEVSVRDFTISPDSGVRSQPGTYAAFTEKLPYLKDLGVTHVQLLPVLKFCRTNETSRAYEDSGKATGNNYNWGYDPQNYFTPEGWYSEDPEDPYRRVAELKHLVKKIHRHGMGVILDVVYNHMARPDFLDDVVPGYYFRRSADGNYTSNSGCGNDIATEREMARRLIVDSAEYWVSEYRVDGFRFDLMGLIDSVTMESAFKACSRVKPGVLFIGEGWKMYNGPTGTIGLDQNYMMKTDDIAVFNDEFRDLVKTGGMNEVGRRFITGGTVDTELLFRNVTGRPQRNYRVDSPGDSVQYIAAHDGLTLHDNVVFNTGLTESKSEEKAEILRRLRMGNFILLTSQGIAFMHAGQERGRTKPRLPLETETVGEFVRNSYASPDGVNRFVWTLDAEYQKLADYVKGLIALRRAHGVFRLGSMADIEARASFIHASGTGADSSLCYSLADGSSVWYILMNADKTQREFPLSVTLSGTEVYADAERASALPLAGARGLTLHESSIVLDPLACAVVRTR